jgi:hypothetical protein
VILGLAGPAQADPVEFIGFGEARTEFGAINQAKLNALAQAADAGFSSSDCVQLGTSPTKFFPQQQIWRATATYECE